MNIVIIYFQKQIFFLAELESNALIIEKTRNKLQTFIIENYFNPIKIIIISFNALIGIYLFNNIAKNIANGIFYFLFNYIFNKKFIEYLKLFLINKYDNGLNDDYPIINIKNPNKPNPFFPTNIISNNSDILYNSMNFYNTMDGEFVLSVKIPYIKKIKTKVNIIKKSNCTIYRFRN